MFYRPVASRLLALKFLGLFGNSQTNEHHQDDGTTDKITDVKEHKLPLITKNKLDDSPTTNHQRAIDASSKKIIDIWLEKGIPGLTISVSKRGQVVWTSAFGYCDVENQIECVPDARMRIASICKPLFVSTVVGPMIDQNKIDIKSSVHNYLSPEEFPKQNYNGKQTDITIEQLLSHTSGIKHYGEDKPDENLPRPIGSKGSRKVYQSDEQFTKVGFYQRKTYRGVIEALEPFKDGPLANEPGMFNYTTYGYTLLSAVIEKLHQRSDEKIAKEQIEDHWIKVLHRDWQMKETTLDQDEPILPKRARYYLRTGINGNLINAPYTDNSVKWAGGGLISTTNDLVKFANGLIDSYKGREGSKLKAETISLLWKQVKGTYALGFSVEPINSVEGEKRAIYHSGAALGASSILIIYPESEVVVAMIANMGSVDLRQVGMFIADQFAKN